MSVIEKFASISSTLTNLFDFLVQSDVLKEDVNEYLKTVSANTLSERNMQSVLLPYLFERTLNKKSIFDIYLSNKNVKDKTEQKIVKALSNSFESVFEIKKTDKSGFVFQNLLNENVYDVLPLVKMTNFRGVLAGQFVIARIFEFENTYYLIEIANVYASYQKDEVYRFAVAKLLEKPELLYVDNKKKLKELENTISKFSKCFNELFGGDEIITTNDLVDEMVGIFNDYCEKPSEESKEEVKKYIAKPSEYKFFEVKEFNSQYGDFLENSMQGFSAHSSKYDVGVIFDSELGLYIIPFWATICEGFTGDYTKIEGYEKCLKAFLENDKIPHTLISRLNDKYKKFLKVVNAVTGKKYTIEELLAFYKADSLEKKIFSPTSVLYSADVFSKTLEVMEKNEVKKALPKTKVRPNEPCPCGSGKKYKKCCDSI